MLSLVSGCARPAPAIAFPAASELQPPAKPVPGDDIATSDKAGADYDSAVEAWGDAEARQIGRLCRWGVSVGVKGLTCPPPEVPPPDPGRTP